MPIFEYKCECVDCQKVVERIEKESQVFTECESCGAKAFLQISKPAVFNFKGGDFGFSDTASRKKAAQDLVKQYEQNRTMDVDKL